jgi:hypothetical protein
MYNFIAFGDSFIEVFYILRNKNFEMHTYYGTPIKGLINKNDKYNDICEKLSLKKYDYGFFSFGQVDFYYYIYKKKYLDKNLDILDKIYDNCEKYVKLIYDLPNIKYKYISGIYPNHITNKNYKKMLIKYNIFTADNVDLISNEDLEYENRNSWIKQYNLLLEKYCKKYNITFCNIYDFIVDKKGIVYNIVLLRHDPYEIHLNSEILLFVYLKKYLSFLLKYYKLDYIYKKAEKYYNIYLQRVLNKMKIYNDLNYNNYKFNRKKVINFIDNI